LERDKNQSGRRFRRSIHGARIHSGAAKPCTRSLTSAKHASSSSVFSHDAGFLRQIRDKCEASECVALQLADHRSLGIKIMPCDLDEACRGRAASDMDDLQAYVTTGAGKERDIIQKMRIVLETHCRYTFSGSFETDDRVGGMVEKIKTGFPGLSAHFFAGTSVAINHRQPRKADRYFSSPHSERISRHARAIFSKVSRCSGDALRAIRSHSSAYLR
jgi:hypothetical protein